MPGSPVLCPHNQLAALQGERTAFTTAALICSMDCDSQTHGHAVAQVNNRLRR